MSRAAYVGGALAAMVLAGAAQAQSARIYQAPDRWFTVAHGAVAYSVFYPNAADGTRSFGAEGASEAIMNRVKTVAPPALFKLGVALDLGEGCAETQTQNAAKTIGWAYACTFAIRKPSETPAAAQPEAAPAGPATRVASLPTPARPVAATPAGPTAAAVVSVTPPSARPSPDAQDAATAALNAKVRAASEAVDARNRQRDADFEAAKQQAAATYAKEMADHAAKLKAQEAAHDAEMAAWRARVAACQAGDTSQCAPK